MFGPQDELLYVGKSIRVKTRLLSYFRANPAEKAGKLIRDTKAISWEYVPNEFAALLVEMRLIKRWKPRFNVEHKRKRSFAFIKITSELAPRILSVSRILPDGGTYFGPFPRPRFLALTLRELSQALGLRDCAGTVPVVFQDQLEFFQKGRTPRCLRAETTSCLAPCCGRCSSKEYARRAEAAKRFLEGRDRLPLRLLKAEMAEASAILGFEHAATLRDRLLRLESLQAQLVAFRGRVEGLSFIYRVPGFKGNDRLYFIRKGLVEKEMAYPKGKVARLRAASKVHQVYAGNPMERFGSGTLTPEAASEILLVARWFRLRERELERASTPEEWLSRYAPETASRIAAAS